MTAPMDTGGTTASITIVNLAEMYTIAATILYINAIATLSIYWRTKARSDRFHLPPTTAEMIALSFKKESYQYRLSQGISCQGDHSQLTSNRHSN